MNLANQSSKIVLNQPEMNEYQDNDQNVVRVQNKINLRIQDQDSLQ
jgi:hypothetical protein